MDRRHCDWCDALLRESDTWSRMQLSGGGGGIAREAVNEIVIVSPFPGETLNPNQKDLSLVLCERCDAKFWLFLDVKGNIPLLTKGFIVTQVEATNGGA